MKNFRPMNAFAFLSLFVFISCASSVPIGVKMEKNIYLDQNQVDVESWLSYYSWKYKYEGEIEANNVLPDSSSVEPEVWSVFKSKTNIYDSLNICYYTYLPLGYFSTTCDFIDYNKNIEPMTIPKTHKCPFLEYPITGLTYEQVVDFCNWKTKQFGNNIFEFRLPSEQEWKHYAVKGLTELEVKNGFPDSLYSGKICPKFNYKLSQLCEHFISYGFNESQQYTNASFPSSQNRLFDIFGSVSEMTSTKGVAKGGNYLLNAIYCHPDSVQTYNKPEIWLGFRCITVKKQ